MRIFVSLLSLGLLASAAQASDFDARKRAAEAAASARHRATMNRNLIVVEKLARQAVARMAAPHGGVAKANVKYTWMAGGIFVMEKGTFTTRNGLACDAFFSQGLYCNGPNNSCPKEIRLNVQCYDRSLNRYHLAPNGKLSAW